VGALIQEKWRDRLRQARERAGLSRVAAAKKSGVSAGTWRNVETGKQHVSAGNAAPYSTTARTVAKMAAAVRLDPREMLVAAGFDPDSLPVESVPIESDGDGDVRIIVVRGTRSTDEVVEEVRRILDGMNG
jgi:transcriptional regulator with XRE-family HTH domain